MHPWYKGFKGSIQEVPTKTAGKSYVLNGIIGQARPAPHMCQKPMHYQFYASGFQSSILWYPPRFILQSCFLLTLQMVDLLQCCQNPIDLLQRCQNPESLHFFKGIAMGAAQVDDGTVDVTELPVRKWTQDLQGVPGVPHQTR